MVIEEAQAVREPNPTRNTGPYALAAMDARYVIERGDWAGAAKLHPQASAFRFPEALE